MSNTGDRQAAKGEMRGLWWLAVPMAKARAASLDAVVVRTISRR